MLTRLAGGSYCLLRNNSRIPNKNWVRDKMGSREITESRIEAALQRLDNAVQDRMNKPTQGTLDMGGDLVLGTELESLREENRLLRQELLELTAAYNGLKDATETVSGRLDKTIDNIGLMLEQ